MSAERYTRTANLYVSNRGYTVEVLGRVGIRYAEGSTTAFVDSEVLAAPAIAVFADNVCWEIDNERVPVNEDDRQRIITRVKRAIESFDDALVEVHGWRRGRDGIPLGSPPRHGWSWRPGIRRWRLRG